MRVQKLAPGLWRWTAGPSVGSRELGDAGCVYCEPPPGRADRLVVIDPLVPAEPADAARFWDALDRDVERLALPVSVLVGNRLHRRSAFVVAGRYRTLHGADVRAHGDIVGLPGLERAKAFRHREALPAGIVAWSVDGFDGGETAFHIPHHAALVVARSVVGTGGGRVELAAAARAGSGRDEALRSIRRVLDLPFDLLVPSYGEPVLRNGRQALREAIEAGERGDRETVP